MNILLRTITDHTYRKSKTPSRIKANLEGDFKLDAEEVEKVDALDKKLRFNDPSESFGWSFYTDLDGKRK